MTKTLFEGFAEGLGLHVVDDMAYGIQDGFPFSIELEGTREQAAFRVRVLADGDVRSPVRALRREKTQYVRWHAEEDEETAGGVLVAVATPPTEFYAKGTLRTLLLKATAALLAEGLAPPTRCPLCGAAGCDVCADVGNACRQTHKACLQTRLHLPDRDVKTPVTVRGNWVLGALGALVGALVGAVPNWAQALSKGNIQPVFYAFIPVLSILLYRLFRGKASRLGGTVCVVLASFAAAFALELCWYWLVITSQLGFNMSLAQTTAAYFVNHTFFSALQEMLMSLVFLALGFLPAAAVLRQYVERGTAGGEMIRGATFVRESAFPLHPEEAKQLAGEEPGALPASVPLPADADDVRELEDGTGAL